MDHLTYEDDMTLVGNTCGYLDLFRYMIEKIQIGIGAIQVEQNMDQWLADNKKTTNEGLRKEGWEKG